MPMQPIYDASTLEGFDADARLGAPGRFPFTRGVYPSMYTGRPWTMRQYAGFGTAKESNERYHELVNAGTGGLSVAFDLPTQMGYDSDEPIARGEVGKVGVAIDSIDDMRTLFQGLPLEKVSTSMTINATASALLLLYQLVAAGQGVESRLLTGTIQNDVLKEYIARGTYIYPPQQSLRLISDIFAYCHREIPRWNTISVSGYHMAEAGATPVQEIAFTLANAKEYVRTAIAAGLDVDDFAPRLSFFFVVRTTLLEEVAKFRAARRIWSRIMREEFGARNPKSQMLRFHTQTALPTQKAARLALRTQQVIAYETDVTKTVDPFAGSYFMEAMTDELEAAILELIQAVDDRGGAVAAIEQGFQKSEIERSAYRIAQEIDNQERTVVGVNKFVLDEEEPYEPMRVDPQIEVDQCERLAALREERDNAAVERALDALRSAAQGTGNVLLPMREALGLRATVGEVSHALRDVWGVYVPTDAF
ncbi:acyl-CoA mutase large subunit family protein [Actinoallomurus sp. CA-142502]|uniref:acyl-CoA mutase large subunit family protein n=1 Tax=Actinoallomurus sp. CA-142502 TaxID=3239885 RepID=UPI003D92BB81